MQWQTTTMTTLVLWHTGGVMLWSLIKHTGNSSTLVISEGRRNRTSVNPCILMPWIKNLETLINITSMHLLVTTQMAAPLLAILCVCLIALIIIRYMHTRAHIFDHSYLYIVAVIRRFNHPFPPYLKINFPCVVIRLSDGFQAMTLALKNMLRYIIIGRMCRKHFMLTRPKSLISGLLAGNNVKQKFQFISFLYTVQMIFGLILLLIQWSFESKLERHGCICSSNL